MTSRVRELDGLSGVAAVVVVVVVVHHPFLAFTANSRACFLLMALLCLTLILKRETSTPMLEPKTESELAR